MARDHARMRVDEPEVAPRVLAGRHLLGLAGISAGPRHDECMAALRGDSIEART